MIQQMLAMSSGGGGGKKGASGWLTTSDWDGTAQTSKAVVTGLGFTPKHIAWFSVGNPVAAYHCNFRYDADIDASKFYGNQGTADRNSNGVSVGDNTLTNNLQSVDSDGFTLGYYVATYGSDYIYWIATE